MILPNDRFEPARFSSEELVFMLDQLEKPPHAALHRDIPPGVNPAAIENGLGIFYRYAELERHEGVKWVGYDAIRDSIERYLDWHARVERIRKLGGPQNPSMHVWDGDRPYRYGIGADSGDMVRTEILDNGERREFGLDLRLPAGSTLLDATTEMPWVKKQDEQRKQLIDDIVEAQPGKRNGTLTCSVCGQSESFDPASRASKGAALARMGRHLKSARTEINRHRLLYRKRFQ